MTPGFHFSPDEIVYTKHCLSVLQTLGGCFTEKISTKRQKSAEGAADLRRRAAPSARTRYSGAAIDAEKKIRLLAKPASSFKTLY